MSEKVKCSKESPCEDCQKRQQELLAKTEDWEVKKKEKIEKFEFVEAEFCSSQNPDNPNKIQYSSFCHGKEYKNETCPSCQAVIKIIKSNSYGDKTEELKEHASSCRQSNQIKSNQIKSNSVEDDKLKTNYWPWILGGAGVLAGIGIIIYFILKNKKGGEE